MYTKDENTKAINNDNFNNAKSIIRELSNGVYGFETTALFTICSIYRNMCKKNMFKLPDEELEKIATRICESEIIKNEDLDYSLKNLNEQQIKEIVSELISGENFGSKNRGESTTRILSQLVYDLLEFDGGGDTVMDLGSGKGSFLSDIVQLSKNDHFVLKDICGVEKEGFDAKISKLALSILCEDYVRPTIINEDMFSVEKYPPYNKGYTFPSLNYNWLIGGFGELSRLSKDTYVLSERVSPEWIYIDSLLYGLKGGEQHQRAVALVSGRTLFNKADKDIREIILKQGWLEGIIELPVGVIPVTNSKLFLLVFSKNNKIVKFVDASNLIENADNKRLVSTELPIDRIKELYYSKDVLTKPALELINAPNLMPSVISLNVKTFKNGVKLNQIAKVILGSQYTIGVFEKKGLISNKKSGIKVVTPGDIVNETVNWNQLQYIDCIESQMDKFVLQEGDVIVTGKTSKVRTAVYDNKSNDKVLAIGGLLIIRPNLNKIDPTYLKLFLDSDIGQTAIRSIQRGTTIMSINPTDLGTIEIPLIEMKKQKEKALNYKIKLSRFLECLMEVEALADSLHNLYLSDEEE